MKHQPLFWIDALDYVSVLEIFYIKKNDKASYAAVISGLCIRETVEVTLCPRLSHCATSPSPTTTDAQAHLVRSSRTEIQQSQWRTAHQHLTGEEEPILGAFGDECLGSL